MKALLIISFLLSSNILIGSIRIVDDPPEIEYQKSSVFNSGIWCIYNLWIVDSWGIYNLLYIEREDFMVVDKHYLNIKAYIYE